MDGKDIAQEFFLRLFEIKPKFIRAPTVWVYTVGRNKESIKKYIANQLQEDKLYEQISMKEYIDPFTGELVKESK